VPPLGVTPLEFRRDFLVSENWSRWALVIMGIVFVILGLAVLVDHRLVMDGWTDT